MKLLSVSATQITICGSWQSSAGRHVFSGAGQDCRSGLNGFQRALTVADNGFADEMFRVYEVEVY